MLTIHAHGYLRDLLPVPIRMSGQTVQEIIEGLCLQTRVLHPKPGQQKHEIRIAGFDTVESLIAPIPENVTELHLVPALFGGKSGGFVKIAIGAVLIAASFAMTGPILPALYGGISAGAVFWGGVAMSLGGLLEILSPAPKMDTKPSAQDPEASKYLGAPQNTTKAGTRIPLLYGEHMAYGHYLSFDIDSSEVEIANAPLQKKNLVASNLSQKHDVLPWNTSTVDLADIVIESLEGVETVTATMTLKPVEAGVLTPGTYNANSGQWSVTGTIETVNQALADVAFEAGPSRYHPATIDVRISAPNATGLSGTITITPRQPSSE